MAGWKSAELGHRHYQHPKRGADYFDATLDNFSGLVIYLSLLSLKEQPELWNEFHDENLIFTKGDFESPSGSKLFAKIRAIGSSHRRVADALEKACGVDPSRCPSALATHLSSIEAPSMDAAIADGHGATGNKGGEAWIGFARQWYFPVARKLLWYV